MCIKALLGYFLCIGLTPLLCPAQNRAPATWKSFTSTAGFSVKYPSSWIRKGISKDRLTILSSKGGAEGIVIKNGEAMITVSAPGRTGAPLSQVIAHFTQGAMILSRTAIANDGAESRGCAHIKEIVSEEPVVPPEDVPKPVPYIINTALFCKLGHRVFTTILRNFEGDGRQAQYQEIALKMSKSLRMD